MPGPDTVRLEKSNANLFSNGFPNVNLHSEEPPSKKKKDRSRKSFEPINEPELLCQSDERKKKPKDKNSKKLKKVTDSLDSSLQFDEPTKKEKSRKRRSSESSVAEREPKLAKVEQRERTECEQGREVADPYAVSKFRISDILRQKLKSKGIESLFPIQALTFDTIFEGNDLVGRARTGQGKTLAFVLPILESLKASENFRSQKQIFGRAPSVLVLVPTRELAKQVHSDFELYGGAMGLSTVCIYGGAQYGPQQNALRKGVDVVVGTPGRTKDHLERGTLKLKTLKFRVLDEADEMLNMGFVDDVETILGHAEDASMAQTLLFSATMPNWVKQIASRFLKETKQTVDLVGDERMKASSSVRHLLLPCMMSAQWQLIPDVISCYSSGGRTIIFTETKNDASELASLIPGTSRALHGDIAQGQREATLAGFRSGKFLVLVATDVAARGLDINDVQLIIQCEPPRDVESYIHRSGRTGRAGKTGISVLFNDRRKEYMIGNIEQKAGFRFERISAPQPADIARAACASAQERVLEVSESALHIFRSAADELLQTSGLSPADLLAKALARIAGHTDMKKRSLLTSQQDFATLMLQTGNSIYTPTFAMNILKRVLPEETLGAVRGMSITEDGMGAVFDVPHGLADNFLSAQGTDQSSVGAGDNLNISVLESLPDLQTCPKGSNFGKGGQRENDACHRPGRGRGFGNRGISNRDGRSKRNSFGRGNSGGGRRGPSGGGQRRKMTQN